MTAVLPHPTALTPACAGSHALFDAAADALEAVSRGRLANAAVVEAAIDVCSACPVAVREACLAAALDRRDPHGVWGGLTGAQRAELEAATWLQEPPTTRVASRACYVQGCDHDDCRRLNAEFVAHRRLVTAADEVQVPVPHKPNDRRRRCEGQTGLEGL